MRNYTGPGLDYRYLKQIINLNITEINKDSPIFVITIHPNGKHIRNLYEIPMYYASFCWYVSIYFGMNINIYFIGNNPFKFNFPHICGRIRRICLQLRLKPSLKIPPLKIWTCKCKPLERSLKKRRGHISTKFIQ